MKSGVNLCFNKIIFILLMAVLGSLSLEGKKITTHHKVSKSKQTEDISNNRKNDVSEEEFETISNLLAFYAYDKKASSSKETFFVENKSEIPISHLKLEISYFNTSGKLIHKREVTLSDKFPGEETRKVDIPSWDLQKSFHYIKSAPSAKGSTPYTVKFKILSFSIYR